MLTLRIDIDKIRFRVRFGSMYMNLTGLFTPRESGSEHEKGQTIWQNDQKTRMHSSRMCTARLIDRITLYPKKTEKTTHPP